MMTNKKKITAVITGMALALTVPAAVFAAGGSTNITESTGKQEIPVTGNYTGGGSAATYKVEISWGNMKYNYSTAATEWDTEQHKYVATGSTGAESGFTPAAGGTSDMITVTNSSNTAVTAAFAFTGAQADSTNILTAIAGGFSETSKGATGAGTLTLETAAKDSSGNLIDSGDTTSVGTPTTGARYLVITGGSLSENAADTPLGTVTVTISSGAE
ncbi:MAG: hypothetical protein Q4C91_13240 [Eubacteriales bacterium]|nr:hypothetical protein [Eubacteriales bacterium]